MPYYPENREFIFLLKSMKKEYVESTIKKGRFCFNHPSVFNEGEDLNPAQVDKWDGHMSIKVKNLVIAPVLQDDENGYVTGEVVPFADEAKLHIQSGVAKHTPICCFRIVEANEVLINTEEKTLFYSLGDIADRIMKEFGHDSYVMIEAAPFIERIRKNHSVLRGSVIYEDTLKPGSFNIDQKYQDLAEQIFRKDKAYEWQKEYRIALCEPTENTPVFVELGSIEDITIAYGRLEDLRNKNTGMN